MRLTIESIKFITLFENLTRTKVKDCIIQKNKILFIVEKGEISKAIGKAGKNTKKLENILKKKIKITEFNNDPTIFIKNLLSPIQISNIYKDDNKLNIKVNSIKTKSILIGRDKKNLKELQDIVKRYFNYKVNIL